MHDAVPWVTLVVAGLVAGWVNTLAGAGGVVALPALMLWGLPADLANATYRVTVVAQCAMGVHGFQRASAMSPAALVRIVPATLVGALGGAYVATLVPNRVFEPLLLGTLVLMAAALFWKPDALAPAPGEAPRTPGLVGTVALAGAGFYGGLLQAGVGLVLLAVLSGLLRYDLVRSNALKIFITLAFNAVVLIVFVVAGKVVWLPALIMSIGTIAGAWFGVRYAVRGGQEAVKRVVLIAVVLACIGIAIR
jgi:uncharacterized protein